jgi:hypothetical protein
MASEQLTLREVFLAEAIERAHDLETAELRQRIANLERVLGALLAEEVRYRVWYFGHQGVPHGETDLEKEAKAMLPRKRKGSSGAAKEDSATQQREG